MKTPPLLETGETKSLFYSIPIYDLHVFKLKAPTIIFLKKRGGGGEYLKHEYTRATISLFYIWFG